VADGAALVLDTCACLWLTHGDPLRGDARQAVAQGQAADGIFVSAITAWEVATLVRKGRYRLKVPVDAWFARLLALPGVHLAALEPGVLIASADLPGRPATQRTGWSAPRRGPGRWPW
jgi:PIN domain nuclease of toxin-antitoxin system